MRYLVEDSRSEQCRLGWLGTTTWSALVMVAGVGCQGCQQTTVVPPTVSIPAYPTQPQPARVSPPTFPDLAERTRLRNSWTPDETPRDWQYIVLHHTATNHGDVDSIDQSHRKNKDKNGNPWMGIGYHFVIGNGDGMSDGEIAPTFRWQRQLAGAHAGRADYNDRGIGICLVGNFEKAPPSTAQVEAVGRLVSDLAATYGIASDGVIAHSDVKATECPGRLFPLADVQARVTALRSPSAGPWHASLGPIGKDPSKP